MPATTERFWNRDNELLGRTELESLWLERLCHQVAYCAASSSYFAQLFHDANIDPRNIRSIEQWKALPVLMDKETVRACQERSLAVEGHAFGSHLCAPLKEVVGVYSTSGTTGTPAFYCYTRADLTVHAEMVKRVMWRTGLRPGDSILWGFGLGNFVATSLLPVLTDMGVRVIPVGAEAGTERIVQYTHLTRPDTLIGTPSFLKYLIASVPLHTGKPVAHLGFRRIITGGEPGAGLSEIRRAILDAYDAPIYDLYGPANQFANISCGTETYHGMHVVGADFGIWNDLVDPVNGEPVDAKDGAVGSMVLTEIHKEAAPYLKYAMSDVIEVRIGACECGIDGPRIRVIGRADDMLIVKGVNVFPAAVQNVVAGFLPELSGAFTIHLDRPPPLVEEALRLTVECGQGHEPEKLAGLRDTLEAQIRTKLRVRARVSLVAPGSFELSTRKTPLIVHEYRKTAGVPASRGPAQRETKR